MCGARTRATGKPCPGRPARSGECRCRWHGGLSSGPKNREGRARIAEAQRRRWALWREAKAAAGAKRLAALPRCEVTPVNDPRADTAARSPKGLMRFCSGIAKNGRSPPGRPSRIQRLSRLEICLASRGKGATKPPARTDSSSLSRSSPSSCLYTSSRKLIVPSRVTHPVR